MLDLESLCILAKKLVWSVRVDVHFLDYDGGGVDAACVAVVAALWAFRREDVEVRGEDIQVVRPLPNLTLSPNAALPLNWKLMILVSSYGEAAGEVSDFTYSSYHDVFILFTTCSGSDNGYCGKYKKRRTNYYYRRNIR